MAVDATPNAPKRLDLSRVTGKHLVAFRDAEMLPCGLRKAGLPLTNQLRRYAVQRSDDFPRACSEENARLGSQSFGAANMAIRAHVHNRFLMRVDTESCGLERVRFPSGGGKSCL